MIETTYAQPRWIKELIPNWADPRTDKQVIELLNTLTLENVKRNGSPFAAALVDDQHHLIEVNVNQVLNSREPTAHAEQVVMRNGLELLRSAGYEEEDLHPYTLFTSGEPCVGCRGAIYLYAPKRVVWCVSAALIEKNSEFTEGPPHPEFWTAAKENRGVSMEGPIAFTSEALHAFQLYREKRSKGEIKGYLRKRK